MGIVNGSIPVAGRQGSGSLGTTGTVTRTDFESYKAEQKCTLSILVQKIEGGGYTIGSLMFTTLKESVSYCGTSHLKLMIVLLDWWG